MLLFKTAGDTFNSVIANQKHAFFRIPKNWESREIVLVSKNKKYCRKGEKQIQYIMFLDDLRRTTQEEIEIYWPNNFGRWKFIADCNTTTKLKKPFNLEDIIEYAQLQPYKNITPAMKIYHNHEMIIIEYLKSINAID